jgi:phosphoribosylformylglycinamidine synthase
VASKAWVYGQYDQSVRSNTVSGPGGDAAILRLAGTPGGIALTVDCNARHVYLNPRRGAAAAVAEAARNLVCVGATPLAVTDCLNFGNPYNPDVAYQFRESIEGIREACQALGTPVVSGNVSFYNESPSGPIWPTPTIGMLGEIERLERRCGSRFTAEGDAVVLLGPDAVTTEGSEYEKVLAGTVRGDAPALDLDLERRLQGVVLALIREGLVRSAHDCSEGGLAVTLAECCFAEDGAFGVSVAGVSGDAAALFGEAASRVVVSCAPDDAPDVLGRAQSAGVPGRLLGHVGARGGRFRVEGALDVAIGDLLEAWTAGLPRLMERVG